MLFWHTSVSTERHCRTLPTNFSSRRTPRPEPVCVRRRRHRCLSVVHGCRPLATELSRSPPLVPGTISHAMSRPHHLCQFSAVVWRRTSSGVPSRDFCSACEVTLSLLDTLIILITYLLTYLLTYLANVYKLPNVEKALLCWRQGLLCYCL